jgi:2-polyprenyl-6-hydroxyphenyl methylase/3-demethylubiquinone-9 3-methyltransferase
MKIRWKIAQYFEARWWRHYLKDKSLADYLDWKRNYWKDFLRKIEMEVPTDASILDAGCGPAGIFLVFPENQLMAIDPLLNKYRPIFPHFTDGSLRNARFVEAPLEQLEASQKFDLVFCLNAINHVADLELCLKNLRQATRPSGKLVLSVDAHNWLVFKRLFQFLPGDILHPHQLDLEDYRTRLTKNGFSIEAIKLLKREFFFGYWVLVLE